MVVPTGGGKSLCFQAPAVIRPGLALVVSPLISLMKDQVDTLVGNGVPAALYNSSLSSSEKSAVASGVREGRYRLLYVSPERLVGEASDSFLSLLGATPVSFVAVDEAHCISRGPRLRPVPAARRLKQLLPGVSLHAPRPRRPHVCGDIAMGLEDPVEFVGGFDVRTRLSCCRGRSAAAAHVPDVIGANRSSIARHGGRSTRFPRG
jgi:ATP-dependent DNA helicase RecQ